MSPLSCFNDYYTAAEWSHARGEVAAITAIMIPVAFVGGGAIGVTGQAATNAGGGYLVAYQGTTIVLGGAGVFGAGRHTVDLAQRTSKMSGPQALQEWGTFVVPLAVSIPAGAAGFRSAPGFLNSALESRAMGVFSPNTQGSLFALLGPADDMLVVAEIASAGAATPQMGIVGAEAFGASVTHSTLEGFVGQLARLPKQQRPTAASEMVLRNGHRYFSRSGFAGSNHPEVEIMVMDARAASLKLGKDIPGSAGRCGEIGTLNQGFSAGETRATLEGAVIRTVQVNNFKIKPACDAICRPILGEMKIYTP